MEIGLSWHLAFRRVVPMMNWCSHYWCVRRHIGITVLSWGCRDPPGSSLDMMYPEKNIWMYDIWWYMDNYGHKVQNWSKLGALIQEWHDDFGSAGAADSFARYGSVWLLQLPQNRGVLHRYDVLAEFTPILGRAAVPLWSTVLRGRNRLAKARQVVWMPWKL